MQGPSIDEQRLAFGHVADLYDSARPAYPHAVIDELMGLGGLQHGERVVEVGAGTGKLTRMRAWLTAGGRGASAGSQSRGWRLRCSSGAGCPF